MSAAYPQIADHALIADGRTAALVCRDGTVDWCCFPRLDSASCFGSLLDRERGGACTITPVMPDPDAPPRRRYLDHTLVLETELAARGGGRVSVLDLFAVAPGEPPHPPSRLLRIVQGVEGEVELDVHVAPRFDYGEARGWMRPEADGLHAAIGGDDALLIGGDLPLERDADRHDLHARVTVSAGEVLRLSIAYARPDALDRNPGGWVGILDPAEVDAAVEATIAWWRQWAGGIERHGPDPDRVVVSALVLKALSNRETGAIAAAATTSLPESREGRTWDYRYSWVRDATFSARTLAQLGAEEEADAFRRFVQRSSAGHARELQVLYGVGGERRLPETEVAMAGWNGVGPVRIGNGAMRQEQHDVFGEVVNLAWRWHERGHACDEELWAFVAGVVECAVERWTLPDRGLWEWRGQPRHFVHSKVMCWCAIDRGLALARDGGFDAPVERWEYAREELRATIDRDGVDPDTGAFVQAFGDRDLDAAALLIPTVGYADWRDERMIATADAVARELGEDGFVRRYRRPDGLPGREGAFLPASFWLAECLARQGRVDEARLWFDRASATANDLGLMSEEVEGHTGELLGNFPQALTHLSHIAAALALNGCLRSDPGRAGGREVG